MSDSPIMNAEELKDTFEKRLEESLTDMILKFLAASDNPVRPSTLAATLSTGDLRIKEAIWELVDEGHVTFDTQMRLVLVQDR